MKKRLEHYWRYSLLALSCVLCAGAFAQVDTVYFDIGKMNIRSRKATEKLGAYMFETSDGDKVVYALNKENYRL